MSSSTALLSGSHRQKVPRFEESRPTPDEIISVIDELKKQVDVERTISIKNRMEENRKKLSEVTHNHFELAVARKNVPGADESVDLLMKKMNDAVDMQKNVDTMSGDSDSDNSQEDGNGSTAILLGSGIVIRNSVKPIKLEEVQKIPPYTTWTFLAKNQRMPEDQSVVGRRRIYYERHGGEALFASDSEEEAVEEEEENKDFSEAEDHIIRMTIKEVGSSDKVLDSLAQFLSRMPCEIEARSEVLMKQENAIEGPKNGGNEDAITPYYDKDLDAALDSFDTLFCRRCLVFDCRLHGCWHDIIYPAEKQQPGMSEEEENGPCGPDCYRLGSHLQIVEISSDDDGGEIRMQQSAGSSLRKSKSALSEGASLNAQDAVPDSSDSDNMLVEKRETHKRLGKRIAELSLVGTNKKLKKTEAGSDPLAGFRSGPSNAIICYQPRASCDDEYEDPDEDEDIYMKDSNDWKGFEQDLFKKGVEIFGPNSCLIARNLLDGIKTCKEVYQLMTLSGNEVPSQSGDDKKGKNALVESSRNVDMNENMGGDLQRKSKFLRKRGRKSTCKPERYVSLGKRTSERRDKPYPQYTPCGCPSACGKDCPCFLNKTCCEKYCGCPRSCKKRFRGCHCAKSQCRNRQCPCFEAGRECDPDVCRNCWVGCGDGTLGTPEPKGDNQECRNMKMLLKQQQRVLLGRSDVSGWGAFLKNTVNKHEYLGEYTGEIISHHEADKRGKIYDRVDSSYLFNLNNKYVLDAYRKGNKLKFANHSPNPNCYAKVVKVAGDHRVGIFADEKINAGEELFYDYRYEPDSAPAWAKNQLSITGPKKDEAGPTSGRAKKIA